MESPKGLAMEDSSVYIYKSMHDVYKAPKAKKEEGYTKNNTLTLLAAQPINKSNKDNKLRPKCTLTHFKNMYIKDRKIAWPAKSESSKTLQFLCFQRV